MAECRGRNGWFMLEEINVYQFRSPSVEPGTTEVTFHSIRKGETAPIIIRGDRKEIEQLFRSIQKAVKDREHWNTTWKLGKKPETLL